jgi:hypothetical protein
MVTRMAGGNLMSTATDRRAPGASRISFEAMVEIGGSLGPSFEAQAVNLSEDGMQLRTAYLPDIGQPVTCRFDAGDGLAVLAAGEVLWNQDAGGGGEFGIRFTNLDTGSAVALRKIVGMGEEGSLTRVAKGRKVRLHIEGLASPMRARVKGEAGPRVTAYSELGFLEMGRSLDLEDASSGQRRPALIDGVAVELDGDSRIPQLVVTLRYDDDEARALSDAPVEVDETTERDCPPVHAIDAGAAHAAKAGGDPEADDAYAAEAAAGDADDDDIPIDEDAAAAKEELDVAEHSDALAAARARWVAFSRNAARITPVVRGWAIRAKTAASALAARRLRRSVESESEAPVRRTTAPAPGGGLHTAGRKVVRGPAASAPSLTRPTKLPIALTRKNAAVAGAVGVAALVAFFALRSSDPAPLASAPEVPITPAQLSEVEPVQDEPDMDPLAEAAANGADDTLYEPPPPKPKPVVKAKPSPFGNGPLGSQPVVMRLKMDGHVEKILGASQPTGFTVVIPKRKSRDPAAPLARADARIAAMRVANEPSGAELSVTFKDGVPNYQVRARGEILEIVVAQPNKARAKAPEAQLKKPTKKKRR